MWEQVVLGFDARLPLDRAREGWADEERRHQYLLSPEVDVPLSVDEAVWPRRDSGLGGGGFEVRTPRWATLAEARAEAHPDDVLIAITAWRGSGEPETPPTAGQVPVDPSWVRLGWDVVAGVFPSAVSNCGFAPDDVLGWRDTWGARFNRFHLFDDLPTAFAYRDASNRRVAEHAPFSVLGLYRVR
jgi:hypothetical protein